MCDIIRNVKSLSVNTYIDMYVSKFVMTDKHSVNIVDISIFSLHVENLEVLEDEAKRYFCVV